MYFTGEEDIKIRPQLRWRY